MMNKGRKNFSQSYKRARGFTMVEIVIVVAIVLIVTAIAIPSITTAIYNIRLRSAASDLAGLMQQARILASKNNATYPVVFGVRNGAQIAFVDLNGNGIWDPTVTINGVNTTEPDTQFTGTTVPAAAAPAGAGGQPSAYVLVGDSSVGAPYNNTNVLAYSPRGLPCEYSAPPVCLTPAPTYFVYYLSDTRPGGAQGWAAVVVTKAGRTKTVMWNGTAWH
ncbi:MAG TPA: prepilin-type N-terminal cleavage/methylation domain-containing protein [Candidatus Acidoferrum sp.]|nr:prepilin-type N-terminal cleavage/methylation domain-containing protein [Candidatus Acidoferrum sp.]